MSNDTFAEFDFALPKIEGVDITDNEVGTKVTVHLNIALNPNTTTTVRDTIPYEERIHPDGAPFAIVGAKLVGPRGEEWATATLPNPKTHGNAWTDKSGHASLEFSSNLLKCIEEGSRLTFQLCVRDRKAATQLCSYVYENGNWRLTSKTAMDQASEHASKPERRVKH